MLLLPLIWVGPMQNLKKNKTFSAIKKKTRSRLMPKLKLKRRKNLTRVRPALAAAASANAALTKQGT